MLLLDSEAARALHRKTQDHTNGWGSLASRDHPNPVGSTDLAVLECKEAQNNESEYSLESLDDCGGLDADPDPDHLAA